MNHAQNFFEQFGVEENQDSVASLVYKCSRGSDEEKCKELRRKIEREKKTLFVIVHDEAHHSASYSGRSHDYINSKPFRTRRNVLVLFVSATPYNLQTCQSQVPTQNEVQWHHDEKERSESLYYGIQQYRERDESHTSGVIRGDSSFEARAARIEKRRKRSEDPRVKSLAIQSRVDALTSEYKVAMRMVATKATEPGRCIDNSDLTCGSETVKIMRTLIDGWRPDGTGIMVLLRVLKISDGKRLAKALRAERERLASADCAPRSRASRVAARTSARAPTLSCV